ncbi:MAG: hypothetical protein A3K60_07365 [Euryarchaeota archaeon RBG_19FT_COMBO_56_21]|nr:MAG: hypothetical protein A3K60_07365 [Euryarchaeota archaeon RBG_19FT_COMBO_56_21]
MIRPKEATLAVTYRCNSKCSMCNIWQISDFDDLPAEEYAKLPGSLRTINITGGEPFLRKDLMEVIRQIHKAAPDSRIVISSNGFLTDRIAQVMSEVQRFHPKIGIGVSVDGIGEVHDKVRGVKGSFEKAMATVKAVKALGINDIRLGMTIVPDNQHEVYEVYKLAKKLGVEFTTTVAHNSEIYFKKVDNTPRRTTDQLKTDLRRIGDDHLRSGTVKNWFRAYHLAGITDDSMRSQSSKKCAAGDRFYFMDPAGQVYPCIVMDKVIGNIKNVKRFEDLVPVEKAAEVRKAVRACKADCWMVCNIRSLISSHPSDSLVWILKNKPRAHVSRKSGS